MQIKKDVNSWAICYPLTSKEKLLQQQIPFGMFLQIPALSNNGWAEDYFCPTFFRFSFTVATLSKLWASESQPTSKLTLGKPRSRKRLNPRLLLIWTND
jgi:hypothetical protein